MNRQVRGVTLVELLAVIAIIALLAGALLPAIRVASAHAKVQRCEAQIVAIKSAVESYRLAYGDYPPSTLPELGIASSGGSDVNEGNEALTFCLAVPVGGGPFLDGHGPDDPGFRNADNDSGSGDVSSWPASGTALREIVDPWGNPFIYFHGRQLKDGETATYQLRGRAVTISPVKDPATDRYHAAQTYQLWSLGPNGFNEQGKAALAEGELDDLVSWVAPARP
jgi:prepilin-type N-terminal cleavage/methylation domain-containing protein